MAMIMQARNSSNGGQTTEVLRRQVAMLHLRFYVALFGAFLLAFYVGETYRIVYALALYSFWVPQIILNVYTEAKNPLHTYYIYGMSLTRLVIPLYVFAVPNNFLKEVYPDAPTDHFLFEMVVLWVGIQAAILIAQSKYGARFMIPARFLPPKFDYSRPLPPSMLPPGWDSSSSSLSSSSASSSSPSCPTAELMDDTCRSFNNNGINSSSSSSRMTETQSLLEHHNDGSLSRDRHHTTAVTTRNRLRGKRDRLTESRTSTTTTQVETVMQKTSAAQNHQQPEEDQPTLDCSICYDAIDVRNRRGYMLAPCDHLFHRDCLIQWMDVKMECPICRTELPAL
jgi:Ring finger domain